MRHNRTYAKPFCSMDTDNEACRLNALNKPDFSIEKNCLEDGAPQSWKAVRNADVIDWARWVSCVVLVEVVLMHSGFTRAANAPTSPSSLMAGRSRFTASYYAPGHNTSIQSAMVVSL